METIGSFTTPLAYERQDTSAVIDSVAGSTVTNLAATGSTSTEGVDKLTRTAPADGLYFVAASICMTDNSQAAAHTIKAQVSFTNLNGNAIGPVNMIATLGSVSAIDAAAADLDDGLNYYGSVAVLAAKKGTDITLTALHTITGDGDGSYRVSFYIGRLS